MSEQRNGGAKTADRALSVLLAFGERTEWGVTELSRQLGFDKAVTHRLLTTLSRRGFLLPDPQTRRYRLGAAVGVLARAAERGGTVEAAAKPVLEALAHDLGESAILNIPHGAGYRCAAAVDAAGPMGYSATVGEIIPANAGAAGHAIFAFYPEEEARSLFKVGPLPRFDEATITDPDRLFELYATVRAEGIAITHGEYDPSVTSVAAPVFAAGQVIGSLVGIGPYNRMVQKVDTAAARVRAAADQLTATLDGRPTAS